MTIDEVRERKAELEQVILKELRYFWMETGVSVTAVHIDSRDTTPFGAAEKTAEIVGISVETKI